MSKQSISVGFILASHLGSLCPSHLSGPREEVQAEVQSAASLSCPIDGVYEIGGLLPVWAVVVIVGTALASVTFFATSNSEPPRLHWVRIPPCPLERDMGTRGTEERGDGVGGGQGLCESLGCLASDRLHCVSCAEP
jgi:hypothetical protein